MINIVQLDKENQGDSVVTEAEGVQQYSQQGYRVVAIVQSEKRECLPCYYDNQQRYEDHIVKSERYVMVRDPDSRAAQLHKKLQDAHDYVTDLEHKLNEETTRARDLEQKLKTAEQDRDRNEALRADAHTKREHAERQMHKYEEDLGKVRKAVGEIKFKEIVGA